MIPRLRVNAAVVPKTADGGTFVAPDDAQVLGWWADGARPGDNRGSALVAGHILRGDRGAEHDLAVAVVSEAQGFAAAKAAAAAVCDALLDADLALGRGRLVLLRFLRAQASRPAGGARRIDLTFRARVEDGA